MKLGTVRCSTFVHQLFVHDRVSTNSDLHMNRFFTIMLTALQTKERVESKRNVLLFRGPKLVFK